MVRVISSPQSVIRNDYQQVPCSAYSRLHSWQFFFELADGGIFIDDYHFDAGHFGTEFPVVASLAERLREELRGEGHVEVLADRESKDFFSLA